MDQLASSAASMHPNRTSSPRQEDSRRNESVMPLPPTGITLDSNRSNRVPWFGTRKWQISWAMT